MITNNDPRWIGAWWGGYLIFAAMTLIMVPLMAMFPKILPRAEMRRKEKLKMEAEPLKPPLIEQVSSNDLIETVKRLVKNKTYFCNTMAAIFYVFGYIPYNYFMNKYLQVQYLLTPSFANTMTGFIGLTSQAFGLLSAGIVVTIFKPRARYLAGWNIVTSFIAAFGLMSYAFLGCPHNNNSLILER